MKIVKKLVSIDLDSTLIFTMDEIEGKKIWKEKFGVEFHHIGWYSKKESLDIDIFYPTINQWMYAHYTEAISNDENYVFLATGRLDKLRNEVQKILDFHDIKFHDVFCNTGGETYKFKCHLFESIIRKNPQAEEFVMYDDRHAHLVSFVEWRKQMNEKYKIKITIVDVVNKKEL